VTTAEQESVKRLEQENRELCRANEILLAGVELLCVLIVTGVRRGPKSSRPHIEFGSRPVAEVATSFPVMFAAVFAIA